MNRPAIAVQALSKRFGRRVVVDNLTFEVPQGSVCGFLVAMARGARPCE